MRGIEEGNWLRVQSTEDPVIALRKLLKWGHEDEDKARATGRTLLYHAVLAHDLEAVKALLRNEGAGLVDVPVRDRFFQMAEYGGTPIIPAAAGSDVEILRELLDARADTTYRTETGFDALSCAVLRSPDAKMMQMCLEYFGDSMDLAKPAGKWGYTYIHSAALGSLHNVETTIRMLCKARGDVNVSSYMGWKPLHVAVTSESGNAMALVHALIESMSDVNAEITPTRKWRMIYSYARWVTKRGVKDAMLGLLACFAAMRTPLDFAAVHGHISEMKELLAARADPSFRNKSGFTALDVAGLKFVEVHPDIKALLAHGEDQCTEFPN